MRCNALCYTLPERAGSRSGPAEVFVKNFELASRKPDLINFSILPAGYDVSWIETLLGSGSPSTLALTGTKDGVNRVFTIPDSGFSAHYILRNTQVLTEDLGDYALVGSTITFAVGVEPQADDTLLFWGWA